MEFVKGKTYLVKFSVGTSHPLYNKYVKATYQGMNFVNSYLFKTVDKVHHPRDEKGVIVIDDNGKTIGYKPTEAYDECWVGYSEDVKKI